MTSPLLGQFASSAGASLVSLLIPPVPECLRSARSLNELNKLAREMMLSKGEGEGMEVDGVGNGNGNGGECSSIITLVENDSSSTSDGKEVQVGIPGEGKMIEDTTITTTRTTRSQSCGSKRPLPHLVLPTGSSEEEKRRKVNDETEEDTAMVVADAVSTGVIQPLPISSSPSPSTSSTSPTPAIPQSSTGQPQSVVGEVFGHIVKTSDTHPIIISPFFPSDLLPILQSHLLPPSIGSTPILLKSDIDVPALLLAQGTGQVVPSPLSSTIFGSSSSLNLQLSRSLSNGSNGIYGMLGLGSKSKLDNKPKLGNLLLSSCPGKRLRMGGPVKGRGPVCRDLKTDLRRIRDEGVGCLVWCVSFPLFLLLVGGIVVDAYFSCLDDTELTLLGTPWETYRDIANELGLDIIR